MQVRAEGAAAGRVNLQLGGRRRWSPASAVRVLPVDEALRTSGEWSKWRKTRKTRKTGKMRKTAERGDTGEVQEDAEVEEKLCC